MWKLWHRLFGCDYIHYTNSIGTESVCRVQYTPTGRPYFKPYGSLMANMIFLDPLPAAVTILTKVRIA